MPVLADPLERRTPDHEVNRATMLAHLAELETQLEAALQPIVALVQNVVAHSGSKRSARIIEFGRQVRPLSRESIRLVTPSWR